MLDEAIQIKDVNAHTRLIENFKFLNISKFKSWLMLFLFHKNKKYCQNNRYADKSHNVRI